EVDVETNVVINEIHYHPIDNDPRGEWLELYNRGNAAVDLSGWSFTGGIDFVFPSGTSIGADDYLVVARDPARIQEVYGLEPSKLVGPNPSDAAALADFGFLRDSGERLTLRDQNGNVADTVHYKDGGQWPEWADGGGSSLELIDPRADNDSPGAWDASDDSHEAPVIEHSYIGRLSTGEPELRFFLQGAGIVLIDDLRMVRREVVFRIDETILEDGMGWKYFKGTQEPSDPRDAWYQPDFADGSWEDGGTPIGFNEDNLATELTDMQNNYISVFLRRRFTVTDLESLEGLSLVLQVTYDDGFRVYINGVPVTDHLEGNLRDGEDL